MSAVSEGQIQKFQKGFYDRKDLLRQQGCVFLSSSEDIRCFTKQPK